MKKFLVTTIFLCVCGVAKSQNLNYTPFFRDTPRQKQQQSDYYNLQKAIEILDNDGDQKEAMKYLDLQLEKTPQNSDVFMAKAAIYKDQEKYGNTLAELNKALRFYRK